MPYDSAGWCRASHSVSVYYIVFFMRRRPSAVARRVPPAASLSILPGLSTLVWFRWLLSALLLPSQQLRAIVLPEPLSPHLSHVPLYGRFGALAV